MVGEGSIHDNGTKTFIFTNKRLQSPFFFPLLDEFPLSTINARTGSSARLSAFHLCIDREETRNFFHQAENNEIFHGDAIPPPRFREFTSKWRLVFLFFSSFFLFLFNIRCFDIRIIRAFSYANPLSLSRFSFACKYWGEVRIFVSKMFLHLWTNGLFKILSCIIL